mgnify:FL=1
MSARFFTFSFITRYALYNFHKERDMLKTIISLIPDTVFVKDSECRFLFVNEACCDLLGHKESEIIGKTDYDFMIKERADYYYNEEKDVIDNKKAIVSKIEEGILRNGKYYRSVYSKIPIISDNKVIGIVGILRMLETKNE